MRGATLALVLLATPAFAGDDELLIAVGKSVTITLPFEPGDEQSITKAGVVDVFHGNTDRRKITFVGKSVGRAVFRVSEEENPERAIEYAIDVFAETPERRRTGPDWMVSGIDGVLVTIVGDDVVIEGVVESVEELQRIDLATRLPDGSVRPHILNLVRLSTAANAKRIADEIRVNGAAEIRLEVGRATVVTLPFDPGVGVNSNKDVVRAFPEPGDRALYFFAKSAGEARYTMFSVGSKTKVEYRIVVVPAKERER